jgi:hypothetical protein
MSGPPADGSSPALPAALPSRSIVKDALLYWEPRRIAYNLALLGVAGWIVYRTWPHFQPALTMQSLPPLLVLAAIANACYCAAYGVDYVMQDSPLRDRWRRRRWILWLAGTLSALLFEYYWIVDEIYPAVPFVR